MERKWGKGMSDLIDRQAAIDAICGECQGNCIPCEHYPCGEIKALEQLPSAEPEPLTDKEQRIFLAAMGREEKVCKEVDENLPLKEPYEDSLVQVCREIVRKVKGALWTS